MQLQWELDLIRVLHCQAEIYEHLAGERADAPVEEYAECVGRINEAMAEYRRNAPAMPIPIFDPRPGKLLLSRINQFLSE